MSAITLAQVCDAIEGVLSSAATLARSQSYDELTEGVHDCPQLQVYPAAGGQDVGGESDRTSFRAGVRQTGFTIRADYYAEEVAHVAQGMEALVDGIDAMQNELEKQDTGGKFGLEGIQSMHWNWELVQFTAGQTDYVGARFIITVRIY